MVPKWPQLEVRAGLLTRQWLDCDNSGFRWRQLIPPVERQTAIIVLAHEGMMGGHLGVRRTLAQVQRRGYLAWLERGRPAPDEKMSILCVRCHRVKVLCRTWLSANLWSLGLELDHIRHHDGDRPHQQMGGGVGNLKSEIKRLLRLQRRWLISGFRDLAVLICVICGGSTEYPYPHFFYCGYRTPTF